MKNINVQFIRLLIIFSFFGTGSCRNLSSCKSTSEAPVQNFVVHAQSAKDSMPNDQATTIFPPNLFLNGFDQPVTGVVEIRFLEIYGVGCAILQKRDEGDSLAIEPGNVFYIRATATQNGLPLHVLSNKQFSAVKLTVESD